MDDRYIKLTPEVEDALESTRQRRDEELDPREIAVEVLDSVGAQMGADMHAESLPPQVLGTARDVINRALVRARGLGHLDAICADDGITSREMSRKLDV